MIQHNQSIVWYWLEDEKQKTNQMTVCEGWNVIMFKDTITRYLQNL